MRNRLQQNLRRLTLGTAGSEIAEAAVVLPLLFMVLIGIFWFGQAFRLYGTVTRAAQEGARAAVAPACTTCAAITQAQSSLNAWNAIQNVLKSSVVSNSGVSQPSTIPTFLSCAPGGGTISTCDSNQGNICVQYNVQLSDPAKGGAGVCGVAVSFQYPYQFWLPFTSLNQQRIQIPALAQVRQETQ